MKPVINFYSYQQRWLKDDSRFKIGMFSRQTGKTFTTCGELVDDCIQAEMGGRRARWVNAWAPAFGQNDKGTHPCRSAQNE